MANYHVLDISGRDEARVVFHIPVPAEQNGAGTNLQDAMKQYLSGEVTAVPWLQTNNPAEYAQLVNGEVYEHVESVEYDANMPNQRKQDVIDARYTALVAVVQEKVREKFRFWGLDRNVI